MDNKLYTYIVIIAATVSFVYWSAFGANALYTFHEFYDIGENAYSMYFLLHYPQVEHGLQLMVYGGTIAPDMQLLLPLYYLAPSPLTLLMFQAFVMSLTSVAIFFVAKDFLKMPRFALLMSLAFLVNPGVFGIFVYDFHAECLIILFYILTFYFYMKLEKAKFLLSALLLLGTIEEAPFLAFSLGAALLIYEYRFTSNKSVKSSRYEMAAGLIGLSIATFVLYSYAVSSLQSSYAQGQYPGLPLALRVLPSQAQDQINAVLSEAPPSLIPILFGPASIQVWYALIIALFGFSIACIFDPLSIVILLSPWLVEFLVLQNTSFWVVYYHYFSYALGGTVVATMLAINKIKNTKGETVSVFLTEINFKKECVLREIVPISLVAISLLLLTLFPAFVYSKNVNNLNQDFLFQISPQQNTVYTQLYSVMDRLPQNASVLTEYFIMPHVVNRQRIELLYPDDYYFKPDYILIDPNQNISLNAYRLDGNAYGNFLYDQEDNYTVYAENGTATLLKRIGST